jgi:hypothetical protein
MSLQFDPTPWLSFLIVIACAALAILRNVPSLGRPRTCPLLWHTSFAWHPVPVASGSGRVWLRMVLRRRSADGWNYAALVSRPVRLDCTPHG